ncbi:MAG: 50S ribosomal protein L10, partial [Gammaproteobacteria bacterium]|nr:50S ribosomal protein L10 [Gammaproteobacteria bacterium]
MMNIKVSQKVKIAQVESLSQQAQSAVSVTVAEYRGLSSSDLTSLRQQARQKGVYV